MMIETSGPRVSGMLVSANAQRRLREAQVVLIMDVDPREIVVVHDDLDAIPDAPSGTPQRGAARAREPGVLANDRAANLPRGVNGHPRAQARPAAVFLALPEVLVG